MSYCSIDDKFGDVYVNGDLLVRMSLPPINITINQLSGKVINWDNQSYNVKNPNNYSYSVVKSAPISNNGNYYFENIARTKNLAANTSGLYWVNKPTSGAAFTLNSYGNLRTELSNGIWTLCVYIPSGFYGFVNGIDNNNNYLKFTPSSLPGSICLIDNRGYCTQKNSQYIIGSDGFRLIETNITYSYQLKIIDGGVTYTYSIIDQNSVNVTNVNNGYEIVISDRSNTVKQVYNDEPFYSVICGEKCPEGTCEIECDNVICCYDLISGQLVKEINK